LSRTLLVVAMFLLLPVMMSGALYGLPGPWCAVHSCCALHHCCAHELQGMEGLGKCAEHEHGCHFHERLQLMSEVARRADFCPPVAVAEPEAWSMNQVVSRVLSRVSLVPARVPSLYGGYLRPQRC